MTFVYLQRNRVDNNKVSSQLFKITIDLVECNIWIFWVNEFLLRVH